MIRIIFFTISLVMVSTSFGCRYHPWRSERYINKETESVNIRNGIPHRKRYGDFFVNDSFVHVFLRSRNETSNSGSPPYALFLSAWGSGDRHKTLIIKSVSIKSDLRRRGRLSDESIFPHEISYESSSTGLVCAHFSSDYNLHLDFRNNEKITIFLNLEVRTKDKIETKSIRYRFVPLLKKGLFIWLSA